MPPQYKSLPTEEPKSPLSPPSLRLSIARNYSRRVFALIAVAILLFGSICHVLKKSYDSRHHRKATPSNLINPPRLSDMNEHFFGYGVDHDDGSLPADLQSGLDSNNLAQNLGLKEEDSVDLMLSDDDAGIDFWSVETEKVFADPPKRLDGTSPNPNTPPGNMLIRPVPARFPHPPDPKHPNVCLGPPKYEWNGPDEFVVDSNQFDRLYMLSRSPYIRARFRIRERGNEDTGTDNILIRPNIRLGEAEMNNILEVSQLRNTTRKSYILRLATPSWEESGNGRFNCIFADIDVILPKSLRSLSLLGAGAVNGGVWFGKLPPITTLVGWAGQGHVRLESAPNVDKAIVAVKNGVIDANRIKARTAVKMKIVNGPIKVGILPLVETEKKSTDGNLDDEGLSIRLRSVNGAVNARVDESFQGTFVAGTVNGIVKVTGERLNFDRNGHRFASGTHGDVSSPQTMSIEAHAVNGPVFITFEELFL